MDLTKLAARAVDALPGLSAMALLDTELRYVFARGATAAWVGRTPEELVGRHPWEVLPRERWLQLETLHRGALRGHAGTVAPLPTAEARTGQIHIGPLSDDDGAIVGVVIWAIDDAALDQAEARYRTLLECSPDGVVVVDAEGTIRVANAELARLFGYRPDELIGLPVETLLCECDRDSHVEHRVRMNGSGIARPMGADLDLRGRRRDGTEFPVDVSLTPGHDLGGATVTAVVRDVEEQRRTAELLALLETLQSAAPVGFVFMDRSLRVQRVNDTLAAAAGTTVQEMTGRPAWEAVPLIWGQLEEPVTQVLAGREPVVNREVHVRSPTEPARVLTFLMSFYPVRLHHEIVGVGAVASDITERREAAEFRQGVMDTMAEGVCAVDAAGVLIYMNAAAERMLGYTEEELRGRSMHAAVHFQRADGSALREEECELHRVRLEGRTARRSDDAFTRKDGRIFPTAWSATPMADAGPGHGSVVVFRDTSEERSEETRVQRELSNLTWVGRIRDALDEERLMLFAQPIVPLGALGASQELLLRMRGRDGAVIPPLSFLPIAEKYGLIREIDRWVIGRAAALAATGRHVHANLSAYSVADGDLLGVIEGALHEHGADPSHLSFELTETALMEDLAAGTEFAHGLARLGCDLSLDDFGTGFGSFTYLKRLTFTHLKIDREFVRDLASNQANQHLVRGIVSLARGFGKLTVAEGVEDGATLALLRSYGVDFAQGFHSGRPVPVDAP